MSREISNTKSDDNVTYKEALAFSKKQAWFFLSLGAWTSTSMQMVISIWSLYAGSFGCSSFQIGTGIFTYFGTLSVGTIVIPTVSDKLGFDRIMTVKLIFLSIAMFIEGVKTHSLFFVFFCFFFCFCFVGVCTN